MSCDHFHGLHEASVVYPTEGTAREVQRQMDGHLAECPVCRARLQNYVITTQALRKLGAEENLAPPPPLPEPLVQRMLTALRAARTAGARGIATA